MRLSLQQLWDMQTGELLGPLWQRQASRAKPLARTQSISRVTMGSVIADFINGKTASSYGPLDKIIDQLIQIPQPENGRNADNPEPVS